jgi:hypothetical protein
MAGRVEQRKSGLIMHEPRDDVSLVGAPPERRLDSMITMLGRLERLEVAIRSLRVVRGLQLGSLATPTLNRAFGASGRISLANSLAATPFSKDLKLFPHALPPL